MMYMSRGCCCAFTVSAAHAASGLRPLPPSPKTLPPELPPELPGPKPVPSFVPEQAAMIPQHAIAAAIDPETCDTRCAMIILRRLPPRSRWERNLADAWPRVDESAAIPLVADSR